jgi:hypothetical protein
MLKLLTVNYLRLWHRVWLHSVAINFMKTIILCITGIFTMTVSQAAGTKTADHTAFRSGGGFVMSVSLANFKGVITNNLQADLSWTTMMESGVAYFEIQRSGDGMNFQDIDSVKSKMTISTNVYQLQYSYTDAHPLAGTSFYRIKVIGKNGYTNQSPVVQISNNADEGIRIYPTLIQNNMVFVETNKNLRTVSLEFFDLSGKKISETNWESLDGRQNIQISKSGILPTGTYIARLTANGQDIKTQLVIVQSH